MPSELGGSGTVSSVAQTVPAEFSVAGSPVTGAGTLAISKATQAANTVWAGPTSGGAQQPAFRALVVADVPTLNQNTTGSAATLTTARNLYGFSFNGSASTVSGTDIIASGFGGTGNGFTKFSGPTTSEKTFTLPNATATILTTAAAVTVAQGGTGLSTLTTGNVLLGAGTGTPTFVAPGTSGNVLTSNGSTWTSAAPAGVDETSTTASSATPTPTGGSKRNFFSVTALAEAATFAAPSGTPADNNILTIRIKDNGTARALSFNAIYRAGTDLSLPTTTVVSKTMYLNFRYNSADSKWDYTAYVGGF